jgi:hypothetical protein
MIYIAHRGLIFGPDYEKENKVSTIDFALDNGFDVELDLWVIDHKLYLGHDFKDIKKISFGYISERKENLWIHAKNSEALQFLSALDKNEDLHYFWHQEDDYTLTSKNIPWIYPGRDVLSTGVIVMPELVMEISNINNLTAKGVCSDYVDNIRENHSKFESST